MIRYSLRCAASHDFDSWFRSSDAFDGLQKAGHVACPICGSADVHKSLMAPAVRPARTAASAKATPDTAAPDVPVAGALSQPGSAVEQAFAEMRRQVEANSEYVGLNFAAEARRIHDGATPARSIYGEAKPEEARQLIEDGVPVAPLPFMPARKIN
jgi:hypothetical protein